MLSLRANSVEPKEEKIFRTQSVDLGAFLVLEGIKFLGCEPSDDNPRIMVLAFDDHKQSCVDLERVWLNSEYKKYRDINKWLLSKVHQALKS